MGGNGINAQIECTMYMCTVTHTWSQIRRKTDNNPKTSSNHSKTMLPFTKQHPYSVCAPAAAGQGAGLVLVMEEDRGEGGVFACAFLRQKSWLQRSPSLLDARTHLRRSLPGPTHMAKCACAHADVITEVITYGVSTVHPVSAGNPPPSQQLMHSIIP